MGKEYSIKPGYKTNPRLGFNEYIASFDHSASFQVDVYRYAKRIAQSLSVRNVLDLGCGCYVKLKEFIAPVCSQITGVDNEANIETCRNANFGTWIVDDIENPSGAVTGLYDLIISADVIEHLSDPTKLLSYMREHAHQDTRTIISTPERDLCRGGKNLGPGERTPHVREWNRKEFHNFLEDNNFEILDHFLVPSQRLRGLSRLRYGLGLVRDIAKNPSQYPYTRNLSLQHTSDIGSMDIVQVLENLKFRIQRKTCQVTLCKIRPAKNCNDAPMSRTVTSFP